MGRVSKILSPAFHLRRKTTYPFVFSTFAFFPFNLIVGFSHQYGMRIEIPNSVALPVFVTVNPISSANGYLVESSKEDCRSFHSSVDGMNRFTIRLSASCQ